MFVGGGRVGCKEYKMKDVVTTRPMLTNTATKNHRWETLGSSDTGPYAAHPRLKLSWGLLSDLSVEERESGNRNRPKVGPARFGLATFRLSAGRSNRAKLRARRVAEEEGPT